MSSDWPLKKLSDVAKIVGGGTPSTKVEEYYGGEIPWITPKDLSNHKKRYISKGERSITELGLRKSSARIMPKGAVLFTSRAPIGYVAIAEKELCTNQGFKSLVLKEGNDSEFFYYLLKSNVALFESRASGSTFKEVSGKVVKETELRIPPLYIQKKIAKKLRSLDEKLELNWEINKTLEEIAHSIFKSWFVDFEPVKVKIAVLKSGGSEEEALFTAMQVISSKSADKLKSLQIEKPQNYAELKSVAELFPSSVINSQLGEIPVGWKVGKLGDIASVCGGYAFKGKDFITNGNPVIKIKNITSKGYVCTLDSDCISNELAAINSHFKLSDGDVLIAMTGATVGKNGIYVSDGRSGYLNQRVAKIENIGSNWFTYNLLQRQSIFEQIVRSAEGSAQPNISAEGIEKVKAIIPPVFFIEKYQKLVEPLYCQWMNNYKENQRLSELRDTLLPKLLSGELNV